ncbi:MAG: hypothetical protein ACK5C0_09510 [Candidatus Kapaibacterium sp.]|jgi:hypothetical protein
MNLEDYINWNEVISENEFSYYLAELFKNKNIYSSEVLLDIICVLGDKYGKFYGSLKLSKEEKENLSRILFDLTNFSNLTLIEVLIGAMFNFNLDDYYFFLKNNINSIKLDEVKNEVFDSLKEYKEGHVVCCHRNR